MGAGQRGSVPLQQGEEGISRGQFSSGGSRPQVDSTAGITSTQPQSCNRGGGGGPAMGTLCDPCPVCSGLTGLRDRPALKKTPPCASSPLPDFPGPLPHTPARSPGRRAHGTTPGPLQAPPPPRNLRGGAPTEMPHPPPTVGGWVLSQL